MKTISRVPPADLPGSSQVHLLHFPSDLLSACHHAPLTNRGRLYGPRHRSAGLLRFGCVARQGRFENCSRSVDGSMFRTRGNIHDDVHVRR